MMNHRILKLVFCLSVVCLTVTAAWAATVMPIETDELLLNPGKGWMTMFKAARDDQYLPRGIPSAVYYIRINWESVHTGRDTYDWHLIDDGIKDALRSQQQLILRLMPVWHEGNSPLWMRDAGYDGYDCDLNGPKWVADLDDPRVQREIEKLLAAMGERYNHSPGVFAMEINFLGVFGEGHFNECQHIPMPRLDTQKWLVDQHYRFFPDLPIIGPIDASKGKHVTRYMYQRYQADRGAGIFMDAWGDYGFFAHMGRKYPKWLRKIHNHPDLDSWKRGPIKLEPSGVINDWSSKIPDALAWALDYHACLIGNKNAPFPERHRAVIVDALKKIGYRLILRKFQHVDKVSADQSICFQVEIENAGVAPPYRDYFLALKLSSMHSEKIFITGKTVKHWLPGTRSTAIALDLPPDFKPGRYEVALAIIDPLTNEPAIRMPIKGRTADGWHHLSTVIIEND